MAAAIWLNTNLVHLQKAFLCANCEVISEGVNGHCASCGSESLLSLRTVLGGTIEPEQSFEPDFVLFLADHSWSAFWSVFTLTPSFSAMPLTPNPSACNFLAAFTSTATSRRPNCLPALLARTSPALVRSEMLIRSCSARVAMMARTTSFIMPQESKNGSMKDRHATPQESNCVR
jgi:hypothetical protein